MNINTTNNNIANISKKSNKVGRPTKFTQQLAEEINEAIALSAKGIKLLCNQNPHWPSKTTIFRWLNKNEAFRKQYHFSKEWQLQSIGDDMLDVIHDDSDDLIDTGEGFKVPNLQSLVNAKSKVDSLMRLASRLQPKKYR